MNDRIRPLAFLPNREGFRFLGILKNGGTRECVVILNENGLHTVEGYAELAGWTTACSDCGHGLVEHTKGMGGGEVCNHFACNQNQA